MMASNFLNLSDLAQHQVRIAVAGSLKDAVKTSASKTFKQFASNATTNVQLKKGMLKANQEIALGIQDTVLRAYDQRVTARKVVESYRIGDRFSGGKLRDTLNSDGQFVGTADGIAWGDTVALDRDAAHWYRLNYGAGGIADELYQAESVTIPFAGGSLGPISLDSPASADFSMPRGWPRKPGLPFYPTGRELIFPTRGIAGRRFFDAGLKKFKTAFPPAYNKVMQDFFSRS